MADLNRQGDQEFNIVDKTDQYDAKVDSEQRLWVDANITYQDDAVVIIQNLTRRIWDGHLFEVSQVVTKQDNEEQTFLVKVDSDYNLHIDGTIISEAGTEFYIYEAPTTTANGTLVTPINTNRSSTNTLNSLLYGTPTVTSNGTLLRTVLAPGTNQSAAFSEQPGFIFKYGTDYLVRIVSRGNNNDIGINMFMYERSTSI